MGVFAAITTSAGAFLAIALWLFHLRPTSALLGDYAYQLAHDSVLRDQVLWLSATLGAVGMLAALLSIIGGRLKASTVVSLLLGAVALSYPLLALTGTLGAPFDPPLFPL